MQRRRFSLVSLLAAAACGSSQTQPDSASASTTVSSASSAAGGAGGSGGGVAYPAPHPPLPQVVKGKGPVMAATKMVTIVFKGDPLTANIATFANQIAAASAYWSAATAEYGAGPLSAIDFRVVDEMPAVSLADSDVQSWLADKIAKTPGFPQPDATTLYAIYYPDGTTVTLDGAPSCQAFGGYHNDFLLTKDQPIVYAVMPRCPPDKHAPKSVTVLDQLTATASHELKEAATDPYPSSQPAYADIDADHRGWLLLIGGGEIGDICAPFPGSFYPAPGFTSLVQRVWSNQAAAASHDPCQPAGATPYFNSVPVLPDTVFVPSFTGPGELVTKGVKIALGGSKTIDLDLFSDAPTPGPWTVKALDVTAMFTGKSPALELSLDRAQGQNGDVLHLTIKALSKSPFGAAPFWIQNELGGTKTVMLGVVAN